jgi:hypothetical protein
MLIGLPLMLTVHPAPQLQHHLSPDSTNGRASRPGLPPPIPSASPASGELLVPLGPLPASIESQPAPIKSPKRMRFSALT